VKLPPRLVGAVGSVAVGSLLGTVRWDSEENAELRALREAGEPLIYVLWHGRLLPLTYYNRGRAIHTLISRNVDGEYIARVVERWGYHAIRGSSSRGASAGTRGLLRALRGGNSVAVTPDGPRGPREVMKAGVIFLARASGAPLVPAAAAPTAAWTFGSWDRFVVPKPFSRVRIRYGTPRRIPREVNESGVTEAASELGRELNALTAAVDREVGWDG